MIKVSCVVAGVLLAACAAEPPPAHAQSNFEIQVYPSETIGVGFGLTRSTDPVIVKVILGRRFDR